MKKIYVSILAAALTAMAGLAQENLQKEITLAKDFVPVVKKATKKSALPRVLKPVKGEEDSNIDFSAWAEPTAVSVEIPTMLPYGYRTGHRFSNQRGYLDLGAGTQLNFVGSAGYRIVDDETLKVSAWMQHNSTWTGKNTSKFADATDTKQKFCDNVIGIDANTKVGNNTLDLGASVHFDNFNYYGNPIMIGEAIDTKHWWDDNQNFLDINLKGAWKGRVNVSRFHDISYMVGVNYNYAGYEKGFDMNTSLKNDEFKGAKEHYLQVALGAKYAIEANSSVGADVKFDIQNRSNYQITDYTLRIIDKVSNTGSMLTLSPYYTYYGQNLLARLGVNVNFSFGDGTKFRFAPNVQLAYEFTPGVSIYANATGGKQINTLSRVAALNRYLDPNGYHGNTFVPIDAEAGFKVGPFNGLVVKVFGGYGVFKDALTHVYFSNAASTSVINWDCKGLKVGGNVEYKYRSLAEIDLGFTFAPQSDKIENDKSYSGYMLGLDRAKMVANADLKIYPIKGLTVGAGFEYRGGRHFMMPHYTSDETGTGTTTFSLEKMDNVVNLHAGASYRFDKYVTLWAKATNLLNKQWDVLANMGAQKLSIMGGIGLVF